MYLWILIVQFFILLITVIDIFLKFHTFDRINLGFISYIIIPILIIDFSINIQIKYFFPYHSKIIRASLNTIFHLGLYLVM